MDQPVLSEGLTVKTNIPEDKLYLFFHTAAGAVELASAGHIELGFLSLRFGLELAKGARAAGETGADELVTRYRDALQYYMSHYGPC
jgi:hypothetical protein